MNINVKAVLFVSQVSFDNYVKEAVVPRCSVRKKDALKNAAKFIGKQLLRILFLIMNIK